MSKQQLPQQSSPLQNLWRKSQITVWGWAKVAAGTSLAGLHYIGQAVHDPSIRDALGPLQLPAYVGLGLAVIGFITLAADSHPDVPAILSALQAIIGPIFQGISGIVNSIWSEKGVEAVQQATVEVTAIQGEKAVEQKWWFVAIIPPLIALPYIIYIWKAVAWDKVFGPMFSFASSTDPIKDSTLSWTFTMVVGYYLLHALTRTYK